MTGIVGEHRIVKAGFLRPNGWNVNRMTKEQEAKERASIRKYGFVDPLTVRWLESVDSTTNAEAFKGQKSRLATLWEIIDGEHRWRLGQEEGLTEFSVIDLGEVDDDTAMELSLILNELHGQPDEQKLAALLQDLLKRRNEAELRGVMPFSRERFDELTKGKQIDWSVLEARQKQSETLGAERWVERVYRMPADAAQVVDDAINRAREEADATHDWQGLEFVAAEFLAR